ncbi:hypothetical protein NHQ30_005602 [Ciborinia camelliae]|nr:hypothetical protein NHQ30_005602 [Ciborinia camelliae]
MPPSLPTNILETHALVSRDVLVVSGIFQYPAQDTNQGWTTQYPPYPTNQYWKGQNSARLAKQSWNDQDSVQLTNQPLHSQDSAQAAISQASETEMIRELQREVSKLRDREQEREQKCQQLEAHIYEQDKEIREKTQQLEDADNHAKIIEAERKTLKQELKDTKTEMEIQREKTNILARIGVAVRIRYLEQAKSQVMGLNPNNYNSNFIQRGNNAAHRAYGAVDSAIFTGDYLSDEEKAQLEDVFGLIYNNITPAEYGNLPPKMLRAIDHQGSIISIYSLNNGSMSIRDRQAASDSIQFLKDKRLELGDNEFEKDEDVSRHLMRLGELANLIIAKARRQGALSPGTPSTSYGPPQASPPHKKHASPSKFQHKKGAGREKDPSFDYYFPKTPVYSSQQFYDHQLSPNSSLQPVFIDIAIILTADWNMEIAFLPRASVGSNSTPKPKWEGK